MKGWSVEELEELLELKERTQALYFKRRNSRLGEFYTSEFLCLYSNCMIYVELLVFVHFWLIFRVFGNFQKPPGGLLIAARRHIPLHVFWVPGKGTTWRHTPNRQATHGVLPNFGSVGWSAWRYWLNRQATRVKLTRSWYFWVLGWIGSERRLVVIIKRGFIVEKWGYWCGWERNWME